MSAYTDFIDSLLPDHCWHLDGSALNTGAISLTTDNPTGYVAGAPITAGASASAAFDGTNSIDYGDSSLNTGGPWYKRTFAGWGTFSDRYRDSCLYNEGANVRNMSLYFSAGGTAGYIADNDADTGAGQPWSEAIFSQSLIENRPYHLCYVWEVLGAGTVGGGTYMTAYLDGRPIQTKLIYKNNTLEAGGALIAHSGNIELGLGQSCIVSGQVFDLSNHIGLMANWAVWDGVVLDDASVYQLFAQGASTVVSTCTFSNVPAGTAIFLYELNAIGGNVISTFGSIQNSAGGVEKINYDVAVNTPARVVMVNLAREVFQTDVLLPRAGRSFPAQLLLPNDRNYENP